MTFKETTEYLFKQFPVFTRDGSSAYKPGLGNIEKLCKILENPHQKFKSIHVAGTNGKGSSSHFLATILQLNGYKTGLFTSPHLKSFTERIRINGIDISEEEVIQFVSSYKSDFEVIKPSFFEITTAIAFDYFAKNKVDIAIIETGLGGRLDSTNIINPILSLITNIGWDHTDILGDTLAKIAYEKAGIIKKNTHVVISEFQSEIYSVFEQKASLENAPLYNSEEFKIIKSENKNNGLIVNVYQNNVLKFSEIEIGLKGNYQLKNLKGIFKVCEILQKPPLNISIDNQILIKALLEVNNYNILNGRWQTINNKPLVILETAHNLHGFEEIIEQLKSNSYENLTIIMGMVADKNHEEIFKILPKNAFYIFSEPVTNRKLSAENLSEFAIKYHLRHKIIKNVNNAIQFAKNQASKGDFILVCGSNYLISEVSF